MVKSKLTDQIADFIKYQEDLGIPVFLENENMKKENTLNSKEIKKELKGLGESFVKANSLTELNGLICECTKCNLGNTRTNFVFGVGNPEAELVLVGEAPGADEDLKGEPFVGRAGKLLTQTLMEFGMSREDVYICNILKCRPPNNRDPLPDEVEKCEPYLLKQLSLIKPKIILALGRIAGNTLLKKNETLANLRNKDYEYHGIPLYVTYHPAAILRNPNWKSVMLEDFKKVKAHYEKLG